MPNDTTILEVAEDDVGVLKDEDFWIVGSGSRNFDSDSPWTKELNKRGPYQPRLQALQRPTYDPSYSRQEMFRAKHMPNAVLAVWGANPLKSVYAQDIFVAFMRAAAKTMNAPLDRNADIRPNDIRPEDTRPGNVRPNDTCDPKAWHSFTLRNDRLSTLAQDIHSTGLGTLEEIYQYIIPALSGENKLPVAEGIIDLAWQHARHYEQRGRWDLARDTYVQLFLVGKPFPAESSIATKATAILFEFLRQITLNVESQKTLCGESDLTALKEALQLELKDEVSGILPDLMRLYEEQGRGWNRDLLGPPGPPSVNYLEAFSVTQMHRVALSDAWSSFDSDLSTVDIHGWTPLHCAAARGSLIIAFGLIKREVDANPCDLLERRKTKTDTEGVTKLLLKAGADKDAGVSTPLLKATINGHEAVVKLLIQAGADKDARDFGKLSALHETALRGHEAVARLLIESGADKEIKDRCGETPLHRGIGRGQTGVVKLLVEAGAKAKATESDT
ncbi:hypothetical protein QQX98_013302 [Neonectria punicea]|uniref:Clr5 domain-containing protein n=1 Tax=Neonectria punicea TaxID=979145 RepID=A0ABR1GGN9_9HYPO